MTDEKMAYLTRKYAETIKCLDMLDKESRLGNIKEYSITNEGEIFFTYLVHRDEDDERQNVYDDDWVKFSKYQQIPDIIAEHQQDYLDWFKEREEMERDYIRDCCY